VLCAQFDVGELTREDENETMCRVDHAERFGANPVLSAAFVELRVLTRFYYWLPIVDDEIRACRSRAMKESTVVKRSVVVGGHKTSVSLEDEFWNVMRDISKERGMTLSELVGEVDAAREPGNLSSAIRLFVLDHYKSRAADALRGAELHEVRDSQGII
jgi:predicted DNA-binding ribbon-helix-helix protein